MRINKLSINRSAPFTHLDAEFQAVTLVLGDNERGKSRFLNLLSDALFSKPLDAVAFEGESSAARYDAPRLKNLLFFRGDEFSGQGTPDWDTELRALLSGKDEVSPLLQKNFLKSLGTEGASPWLDKLYNGVRSLKETLDEVLPKAAEQAREEELRLEERRKAEQNEENIFPLMVKTRLGREYLELQDAYGEREDKLRESDDSSSHKEELRLNQSIRALERKAGQKRRRLDAWKHGAPVFGGWALLSHNLFSFLFGLLFTGGAFLLLWYGISLPSFHPVKLGALASFIAGAFFLLKTLRRELSQSHEGKEEHSDRQNSLIVSKEHEALASLEQKLYRLRTDQRRLLEERRRKPSAEDRILWEKESGALFAQIKEKEAKIRELFGTEKPEQVTKAVAENERVLEQSDLLGFYKEYSSGAGRKESSKVRSSLYSGVHGCLKELKEILKNPVAETRYPEILSWNADDNTEKLNQLAEEAESLLEKLAKDRYYSEKLAKNFKDWESGGEDFLCSVCAEEEFRQLVQYLFGGKYKTFDIGLDEENKIRIQARTGADTLIPIEELSAAASLQFYFILKLSLARKSLKDEAGVILLDEAFALFDTIRTRLFIDILEAFVGEGWQIVYAMKDDKLVWDEFQKRFTGLKVINLNKESAA